MSTYRSEGLGFDIDIGDQRPEDLVIVVIPPQPSDETVSIKLIAENEVLRHLIGGWQVEWDFLDLFVEVQP